VLLYVFSPLLIALFILPATASATRALYQSLFEVCAWKVVWSVLATLLWSAALSQINKPTSDINFLTVIAFNLILAVSVLFTPMVVHALAGKGITAMASSMMGMAAGASVLSPGVIANRAVTRAARGTMQKGVSGFHSINRHYFSKNKNNKETTKNK
jgi:Na+-translocating ferredoxin:NAD+ oxidoreductase RnfA subunit